MMVRTHRPFGVAMTAATLILVQDKLKVYNTPILTQTLQTIETLFSAYIVSMVPDVDKILGSTHRGITHAVWIPCIIGYFAWKYQTSVYLFPVLFGCLLGYLSHLVADAFSKAGIAWFYPFQRYERFDNGAFYVKGFRGPFIPIYHVGSRDFAFMLPIWRIIAFGLLILLVWRKFG